MDSARAYNNLTMIKALQDVDEEKAVEAISNPDLDGGELSELLEVAMAGEVVNKDTKEPLTLSDKVMAAGLRNRIYQVIRDRYSTLKNE